MNRSQVEKSYKNNFTLDGDVAVTDRYHLLEEVSLSLCSQSILLWKMLMLNQLGSSVQLQQ